MLIPDRQIRPILVAITLATFLTGVLSGCRSLSPEESTQSGLNETRTLIKENVSDYAKGKKLIAMVDKLEVDLKAYEEKLGAHNKAIVKKNADYNASRKDLQKLYNALNKDTKAIVMKIMTTHLEMQSLTTPEEWAIISRKKHRIGGL